MSPTAVLVFITSLLPPSQSRPATVVLMCDSYKIPSRLAQPPLAGVTAWISNFHLSSVCACT
eukprot:scaffold666661_cov59-Prasinocladus_malaysianus.AAC.1